MTILGRSEPLNAPETAEPLWPSPWASMRRRARRHIGLIVGSGWLFAMILVAVFAPLIAPYDPYDQDLGRRMIDPIWLENGSWAHPFGTDALGRDYLSRMIYGARISLTIGFGASFISGVIGVTLGILGGYFRGRVDSVVMYLVNVKLSLPGVLLALALVAMLGSSILVLTCILGFLFWERYAVVTRSVTQQLRSADFVMAARACGASHLRILVREILPNIANHIVVVATLEMAIAILVEAALSFLGLGTQPPTPSWGLMVSEGRNFMFFKPYLISIPGAAIFLLVMAINLLGDGVRDITAPESRN
ncbi:MAG TPA: ABC transporter permease [Xanthobacteraceae bacterium]|nr:ABC transporter permease [Xanthobacteraceae bacterium]